MAFKSTQLNFVTTNQSLWTEGEARSFRISTEDLLVYDSGELTYDFEFDIWVAGASGQLYLDFYVGLEAYAEAQKPALKTLNIMHSALAVSGPN